MNILLLGYGKMGQLIEQLAIDQGHQIAGKITSSNRSQLKQLKVAEIDVAVEFSQQDAAVDHISFCLVNNIPVLSGTTGWLNQLAEIEDLCLKTNGTFFYASNFSIGVNLFFKLNKQLAQLMNSHSKYQVSLKETHHTQKKDAPSGTAITLAEGIIENSEQLTQWKLNEASNTTITIQAERLNDVPGTHIVKYRSEIDDIEIKHTAHSRLGFATGALLVANWLQDKKGLLTMEDFLKI